MRLLLMFSLLTFATGSISAQVATNDSMIIIRMVPEGSFVDSVEVNFAGVWSPGFERNKFIPCKNWMPDSLGGAPFISNRIGFSDGEETWKYSLMTEIIVNSSQLRANLNDELLRLAEKPTKSEQIEKLDLIAMGVLRR